MRTIPNIEDQLFNFDFVIDNEFIPTITNGVRCSPIERQLLSLPAKMGGLGIPIFAELSHQEFENSVNVTSKLSDAILRRLHFLPPDDDPNAAKKNIKANRSKQHEKKNGKIYLTNFRSNNEKQSKCRLKKTHRSG